MKKNNTQFYIARMHWNGASTLPVCFDATPTHLC